MVIVFLLTVLLKEYLTVKNAMILKSGKSNNDFDGIRLGMII